MDARPRTPELADVRAGERPAEALVRANRDRGIDPDWRTAGATWKREEDIPDAVVFRALEGLEKGER